MALAGSSSLLYHGAHAMITVRVKICGNQSIHDVQVSRGADAQGFIVGVPSSPRDLDPCWAKWLIRSVKLFNVSALVTTASDPEPLAEIVEETEPDVLQIHKELSLTELRAIRRAISLPVRICSLLAVDGPPNDLIRRAMALAQPPLDALVLDTRINGRSGGTGVPHDWQISREVRRAIEPFPVILAGGLTPENVRQAIEIVEPYAVDVSSGVERDDRKCPEKVGAFLREVRCRG